MLWGRCQENSLGGDEHHHKPTLSWFSSENKELSSDLGGSAFQRLGIELGSANFQQHPPQEWPRLLGPAIGFLPSCFSWRHAEDFQSQKTSVTESPFSFACTWDLFFSSLWSLWASTCSTGPSWACTHISINIETGFGVGNPLFILSYIAYFLLECTENASYHRDII